MFRRHLAGLLRKRRQRMKRNIENVVPWRPGKVYPEGEWAVLKAVVRLGEDQRGPIKYGDVVLSPSTWSSQRLLNFKTLLLKEDFHILHLPPKTTLVVSLSSCTTKLVEKIFCGLLPPFPLTSTLSNKASSPPSYQYASPTLLYSLHFTLWWSFA